MNILIKQNAAEHSATFHIAGNVAKFNIAEMSKDQHGALAYVVSQWARRGYVGYPDLDMLTWES